MPSGVRIETTYSQKSFIDRAIANVEEALRDGLILVVIILFVFLMNIRTTLITLTAIPLSLFMTAIVFAVFDLSINTMTLGGIAVAMGELVDDAIVDVENIFRRLKENRIAATDTTLTSRVSRFGRGAAIDCLQHDDCHPGIFAPVCTRWHGRPPVRAAGYCVHRVYLFVADRFAHSDTRTFLYAIGSMQSRGHESDGFVLRWLKSIGGQVIRFSLAFPYFNLGTTLVLVGIAGLFLSRLERDFLPPFNEGTIQLNVSCHLEHRSLHPRRSMRQSRSR